MELKNKNPTVEELEAIPVSVEHDMDGSVTLMYMPLPGDPATTKVHDVEFKAYEPTKLSKDRAWLRTHLVDDHKNPWFGDGDDERQAKWDEANGKGPPKPAE